jgi:hypothetical protein
VSTPASIDSERNYNYGFWIVWSPEGKTPPSYRHGTEQSALDEADRLAVLHRGISFYVLAATSRSCVSTSVSIPLILPQPIANDQDIPF